MLAADERGFTRIGLVELSPSSFLSAQIRVNLRLIPSPTRTQTEVCATFRNFQEANLAAVGYALPPNLAIGRIVHDQEDVARERFCNQPGRGAQFLQR